MSKQEKSQAEMLKETLLMENKHSGLIMSDDQVEHAYAFCEAYKVFLNRSKTEREAVRTTVNMLENAGFVPFDPQKTYQPGDKVYRNNRGRALIFSVIGKRPLTGGVKILASHIDSPRIDLKPRPLYEESQLALLKTHYYGGIRKYQWVTIPLALHGVVMRKDGSCVEVCLGEDDDDAVLCINDLLPHLATEQNKRTLPEGIKGEELNVLIGSMPFRDDKASDLVKVNIIRLLNEKYGMIEADFLSADLSLVPAGKARDVGLDRSMVGSYGHDDRVCAYTSLMASLKTPAPDVTWVNVFADKEETGSNGNSGLQSRFLEHFIEDLAKPHGIEGRTVLNQSMCLSADVTAAFDPTFPDVAEKRNTGYLGYGACIMKYTGARGKSGTSEATAEFMSKIRNILDKHGVIWQTGELGKVDLGGGGTVAQFVAKLGADVVDIGVPVLSMHAPFEVVNKCDVYQTYRAFCAFLEES